MAYISPPSLLNNLTTSHPMGSEFLKRDDSFLAYRKPKWKKHEVALVRESWDKDRALAQSSRVGEDGVAKMADDSAAEKLR